MKRTILPQVGISGWCGTGTSTAAKGVRERLGEHWKIVRPASDRFRSLAKERYPDQGDALVRLEMDAQTDLSIDRECDAELQRLAMNSQFIIADARLAGMFMPQALRVYLHCDNNLRFRRIADREGKTFIAAANETIAREEASLARYQELYGVETLLDQAPFDLFLDTGKLDEVEVVDTIVAMFYNCMTT